MKLKTIIPSILLVTLFSSVYALPKELNLNKGNEYFKSGIDILLPGVHIDKGQRLRTDSYHGSEIGYSVHLDTFGLGLVESLEYQVGLLYYPFAADSYLGIGSGFGVDAVQGVIPLGGSLGSASYSAARLYIPVNLKLGIELQGSKGSHYIVELNSSFPGLNEYVPIGGGAGVVGFSFGVIW